jgi:hypothetical protein
MLLFDEADTLFDNAPGCATATTDAAAQRSTTCCIVESFRSLAILTTNSGRCSTRRYLAGSDHRDVSRSRTELRMS